jgi:cholesterol oxidase
MSLKPLRFGRKMILNTKQDPDNPNPTWIPVANETAKRVAKKIHGVPQSNLPEALLNIPATAHILGGAVIADGPEHGVVDMQQRAFGYRNLMVCDGSVIPANPGVNPSLTITALAERTMSKVPPKPGAPPVQPVKMTWEVPRAQTAVVPGTPEAREVEAATNGKGTVSQVLETDS